MTCSWAALAAISSMAGAARNVLNGDRDEIPVCGASAKGAARGKKTSTSFRPYAPPSSGLWQFHAVQPPSQLRRQAEIDGRYI